MSRVFERLGAGQMALGVWMKGGPSWVSTIARAGFDFVRPDMMFSALDWRELDHIHRAAQAAASRPGCACRPIRGSPGPSSCRSPWTCSARSASASRSSAHRSPRRGRRGRAWKSRRTGTARAPASTRARTRPSRPCTRRTPTWRCSRRTSRRDGGSRDRRDPRARRRAHPDARHDRPQQGAGPPVRVRAPGRLAARRLRSSEKAHARGIVDRREHGLRLHDARAHGARA